MRMNPYRDINIQIHMEKHRICDANLKALNERWDAKMAEQRVEPTKWRAKEVIDLTSSPEKKIIYLKRDR